MSDDDDEALVKTQAHVDLQRFLTPLSSVKLYIAKQRAPSNWKIERRNKEKKTITDHLI